MEQKFNDIYTLIEFNGMTFIKRTEYSRIKCYCNNTIINLDDFLNDFAESKILEKRLLNYFNDNTLQEELFYKLNALNTIVIGKNVIKICKGAFGRCQQLKNVILPDNIEKIEEYAFVNCPNLESITYKGIIYKDPETFNQMLIDNNIAKEKVWTKNFTANDARKYFKV